MKYNAGAHNSSINISVSLCSTLSRKTKQKAIGRKKPAYQFKPLKHLLGVKLSDVKENSWLQRAPLQCWFWCLLYV